MIKNSWKKIIGMAAPLTLQDVLEQATLRLADNILSDMSYVLHSEYVLLNSERR